MAAARRFDDDDVTARDINRAMVLGEYVVSMFDAKFADRLFFRAVSILGVVLARVLYDESARRGPSGDAVHRFQVAVFLSDDTARLLLLRRLRERGTRFELQCNGSRESDAREKLPLLKIVCYDSITTRGMRATSTSCCSDRMRTSRRLRT